MTVGIALLLHQDFERAAELTQALLRGDCRVAVHIDAKVADEKIATYVDKFKNQPNLIITKRIKCEWGTFSLVRAQLLAAKTLLKKFAGVDHVVQLSGSCLPTRPLSDLRDFLAKNRGTDFIESVIAGQSNWIKGGLEAERFSLYFPFSWRRQRRLFDLSVRCQRQLGVKRKIPEGLEAHVGSQWWALSRETLLAIINDPHRKQNDSFFEKCWIPDESYFQTLVRKHGKRIESRSLTYSRFDQQGNPMLFYDDHLEYLEHLEGFFVRKVWHGANHLYQVLLNPAFSASPRDPEMRLAFAAQTERLEGRRNLGRAGLSMQSRVITNPDRRPETAIPYFVMVGFNKIFLNIDTWLSEQIDNPVSGELFASKAAESGKSLGLFTGNQPTNGKIRDYAPLHYLTNYIWNNRNTLIAFQFWSLKKAKIFNFLTRDPNASIHYVRSAWALGLMGENITNINALKSRVAHLMELDRLRIDALKNGNAKFKVYSLAESLSQPALAVNSLIQDMAPKLADKPRILPDTVDWQGLEIFANLLKNNGMNIDFKLAENNRPDWRDENSKPVLIAE